MPFHTCRILKMPDGQDGLCMSICMVKGAVPILPCTAAGSRCMVRKEIMGHNIIGTAPSFTVQIDMHSPACPSGFLKLDAICTLTHDLAKDLDKSTLASSIVSVNSYGDPIKRLTWERIENIIRVLGMLKTVSEFSTGP